MVRSVVNARHEAVVRLRVRGPGGGRVGRGRNRRHTGGTAVLADGSVRQFDICGAEVPWGGTWRAVLVYELGVTLGSFPETARHP